MSSLSGSCFSLNLFIFLQLLCDYQVCFIHKAIYHFVVCFLDKASAAAICSAF